VLVVSCRAGANCRTVGDIELCVWEKCRAQSSRVGSTGGVVSSDTTESSSSCDGFAKGERRGVLI
jgi:hypothetical protein